MNLEKRPRSRVTTREEDQRIIQAAENNPFTNARSIREELSLEVSDDTVRRRLHQAGIHHRVSAKKEYLTDAHRAARLAFAQQYVDKGMDFWERTIFTDEKSFSSSNHGKIHLWRRNNTR